jgi:heat shock protein HtpX
MSSIAELRMRMYLTIALVFAIGFAILFVILNYLGASASVIIAVVLLFFFAQWYFSPSLIRLLSRLKYIKQDEMPELHEVVERLATASSVPVPRIAISPSQQPNAFVFGRTRKSATLVVHEGLLNQLNSEELESVLAHEMGHIKHNDFLVMTIVAIVPMLAYIIAESFFFGGIRGNSRNGSYTILIGMGAFLVYFLSQLLILNLSRSREYFADMHSAETTKKPENLASALSKITYNMASASQVPDNGMTRSFYIADGFSARKDLKEIEEHADEIKKVLPNISISKFSELASKETSGARSMLAIFATHPPTYKRILALARIKAESEK